MANYIRNTNNFHLYLTFCFVSQGAKLRIVFLLFHWRKKLKYTNIIFQERTNLLYSDIIPNYMYLLWKSDIRSNHDNEMTVEVHQAVQAQRRYFIHSNSTAIYWKHKITGKKFILNMFLRHSTNMITKLVNCRMFLDEDSSNQSQQSVAKCALIWAQTNNRFSYYLYSRGVENVITETHINMWLTIVGIYYFTLWC